MVIRRIREHVATHNWFAVAVDLGIVVAGVFLGTQVSNWNEARIDRDRGENYSVRLIEELRTTEQSMRGIKLYYADARGHALAALPFCESRSQTPENPFSSMRIKRRKSFLALRATRPMMKSFNRAALN